MDKSQTLKTVFILPAMTPGGAERVLITLMNGLERAKFSPVLISVLKNDSLRPLAAKDIPVHILGKSHLLTGLPRLHEILRSEQPDIVISTMAHMNFVTLLLRPFFPKTKFIVREAIVPSFILKSKHRLKLPIKMAYRYLYRLSDKIISPSKSIFDELKDLHIPTSKFRLLHNPVHIERIEKLKDEVKAELGVGSDEILYVAAGRLHYQKGFDRLLEHIITLKGKWKLAILGEGEQRQELEQLIHKLGLNHKVILTGHKPFPWSYFRAADYFLLPSRWEGLPNVVLESLACGTPVIASKDAGGIAEIAELCNEGSVRLADGMDEFIDILKKLEKPAIEKRDLLPNNFNEQHIINEFSAILLEEKSVA